MPADSCLGHPRSTVLSKGQMAVHGTRRSSKYQECCQCQVENAAQFPLSQSLAFDGYTDTEFHARCVLSNHLKPTSEYKTASQSCGPCCTSSFPAYLILMSSSTSGSPRISRMQRRIKAANLTNISFVVCT